MAPTICLHHKFGHCKYGAHCRNLHIEETCSDYPCNNESCSKRHPKPCRYFSMYNFCKFYDGCSFLHRGGNFESEAMKKEIETLREEIKNLKAVVENMQDQLSRISKDQTCQSKPPSLRRYSDRNSSVRSSLTLLKDGSAENRPSLHHGVPQLDGAPPHVPQVPVIHFQQDEHQHSEDAVLEHNIVSCSVKTVI